MQSAPGERSRVQSNPLFALTADSPEILLGDHLVRLIRISILMANLLLAGASGFLEIPPPPLAISGNFPRFLAILGDSWRFLEITGDSWRFLEILGDSWRFLEIPGDSCRFSEVDESSQRSLETSLRDAQRFFHCQSNLLSGQNGPLWILLFHFVVVFFLPRFLLNR